MYNISFNAAANLAIVISNFHHTEVLDIINCDQNCLTVRHDLVFKIALINCDHPINA